MKRTEQQIQKALFEHLKVRAAPNVFAFAVPNGGYRRPVEAKILVGQGLKAGVPDICIVKEGKSFFLELKSESGTVTEKQVAVMQALQNAGAIVAVTYGLDQALRWLEQHGLLKGRAA